MALLEPQPSFQRWACPPQNMAGQCGVVVEDDANRAVSNAQETQHANVVRYDEVVLEKHTIMLGDVIQEGVFQGFSAVFPQLIQDASDSASGRGTLDTQRPGQIHGTPGVRMLGGNRDGMVAGRGNPM